MLFSYSRGTAWESAWKDPESRRDFGVSLLLLGATVPRPFSGQGGGNA
jgi:hypothetical protein